MKDDPAGSTGQKAIEGPEGESAAAEATLITQIAAGDPRLYAVLVERYQRRLYWSCLGLLGDPDEADDVVQEAFVRAYARLGEYDPEYRFYTWIYRIARNRCLNVLRRRKLWGLLSFSDPDRAPEIANADRTDRSVEDRELGVALAECRERLPADQRECFDLRHAEEFGYAEIARAVGIPEGTVMSRLARAREKMRACLESKGIRWGPGPPEREDR
ncbi:MAG TPA: RNA polymerase sigma factor [Gemmatimonadota bacterium]|nr:RNA polymerase sigma factor [Gemmatimonadota bacterium]